MSKEVEIIVSAKDNASSTFNNVWSSAEKMSKKATVSFDKIRMASGIASVALIALWKKFIDMANDSIEAETKLSSVMKLRANATDAQIQSVIALANQQQKVGIIEDDLTIAGASQLATFAKTTDAIKTLIPAMNNMVAMTAWVNATTSDMVSTANLFWKAISWNITMLTRYGIILTEAQKEVFKLWTEQEKSALLADVITQKFWNMNEVLAGTFAGKMQQLKNQLNNVGESIGKSIMPVITALTDKLPWVIERFQKWIDANPKLASGFMAVALWATALLTVIALLWWPITILLAWIAWLSVASVWAISSFQTMTDTIRRYRDGLQDADGNLTALWIEYAKIEQRSKDYTTAQKWANEALQIFNRVKVDQSKTRAEFEASKLSAIKYTSELIKAIEAQIMVSEMSVKANEALSKIGSIPWIWKQFGWIPSMLPVIETTLNNSLAKRKQELEDLKKSKYTGSGWGGWLLDTKAVKEDTEALDALKKEMDEYAKETEKASDFHKKFKETFDDAIKSSQEKIAGLKKDLDDLWKWETKDLAKRFVDIW
jgi:hypothetical protein